MFNRTSRKCTVNNGPPYSISSDAATLKWKKINTPTGFRLCTVYKQIWHICQHFSYIKKIPFKKAKSVCWYVVLFSDRYSKVILYTIREIIFDIILSFEIISRVETSPVASVSCLHGKCLVFHFKNEARMMEDPSYKQDVPTADGQLRAG